MGKIHYRMTLPRLISISSYWVEIIGQKQLEETKNVKETNTGAYRFVRTHDYG